ncbi:hypothetical protein NE237_030115 [Protea cynaroides]|uniref:Uncharacterized protein n=1 Tax=Protea cynaroides TaxID=273540 RepID=A0A9Q0JWX6_9MAGN|nr:hypothetical protein NE237_030115 [Protea cynaroides]
MDTQRPPPAHRHSYEEDLENAVTEGEGGHTENSVLKKVKEHSHDNDHDDDEEKEEDGEEIEQDPEVHGAAMYESAAARAGLGPTTQLEKDPQAPKDRIEASDPGNYQTKVTDPIGSGGKEAAVSPLISSFERMEVSEEPGEHEPWSSTGSHDQFSPDLSPTETKTIGEKTQAVPKSATMGECGRKVATTVTEKLAPAYEKVAEAGSAVVSKMQRTGTGKGTERSEGEGVGGADKGVSVKEYVVEKLRPRDEDKALSEVISQAFHRRKEKVLRSSNETGKGMMGRLKGAVTSWFGKNEEQQQQQQRTSQASQSSSPGPGYRSRCLLDPVSKKSVKSTSLTPRPIGNEIYQDVAGERKLG